MKEYILRKRAKIYIFDLNFESDDLSLTKGFLSFKN